MLVSRLCGVITGVPVPSIRALHRARQVRRAGPDSRLPFWRSDAPWTVPLGAARPSGTPGQPLEADRSRSGALILEISRTSTSIYIFKNINFSKLQRVNGECLGV